MPNNYFRGDAQPIAQVMTFTVGGTSTTADTITITINRKEITYTVEGSENTTQMAEGLLALLQASTLAEFLEIEWTSDADVITATGRTAGIPFTATASDSGGDATLTAANVTAATGPYFWSNADNWSNGTVPIANETVFIDVSGTIVPKIYYGIDQNTLNLAALTINNAEIGLPDDNGAYSEYRDKFLRIQTANLTLGGTGQGLIRLDMVNGTTSGATAVQITSTPTSRVADKPAVQIKNTHANSTLNIIKGSVGLGANLGETATFLTVRVGYVNSVQGDVYLYTGSGTTIGTLNQAGGTLSLGAGVTTLTISGGKTTFLSGNVTTITGYSGQVFYLSQGTITTVSADNTFSIDFTKDLRPKTVTNCTLFKGSSLKDSFKVVTFTNPILISGCSLTDVTLDLGTHFSVQRS